MVPTSRRALLRAVGAGAVAASAGCTGTLGRYLARFRRHRRDAPVDEPGEPWPTVGADAAHTGAVPDAAAPGADARARAVTSTGRFSRSQPAVVGDRAYLGVDRRSTERGDGEFSGLVAVDLTAERRDVPTVWRAAAGEPTGSFTPSVRDRVVYVPLGDAIRALDARDGSLYWRTRAGGGRVAPAVADADCFTAGDRVVALDAVTGAVRWRSEALVAAPSGLAVAGESVTVACGDGGAGALYCFERADGATRWRYDAVGESYASAVTDGERAYAVGTDGVLHAVGLESGEPTWRYSVGEWAYGRPAVADGTVYVAGTNSERVAALDAVTGDVRWERELGVGGASAPAVIDGTVVYVTATRDGERLLVLDRADGEVLRRFAVPEADLWAIQPMVGDGVAYVVGAAGSQDWVYAVQ